MPRVHRFGLVVVFALGGAWLAGASGGALDPTFGDAGVLTVRTTSSGGGHQVALAADGSLVGMLGISPTYLYRLRPDGTPDPTFGVAGFSQLPPAYAYNAMTLAPDGTILVRSPC